jgi:hypothetical protein
MVLITCQNRPKASNTANLYLTRTIPAKSGQYNPTRPHVFAKQRYDYFLYIIINKNKFFMGRQKSIIRLEGAVGSVSFFKGRDGYSARDRSGVTGERIKSDPAFQRTRENGAEFGRAGKAGRLFRDAFRTLSHNISDGRISNRVTKEMMQILKTDATNDRGLRDVSFGDLSLLQGLEYNPNRKLNQVLLSQFVAAIDRGTGTGTVNLPAFTPVTELVIPEGATHYSLLTGIAQIDFANAEFVRTLQRDVLQPITADQVPASVLTVTLEADDENPLFMVFGIEFLQVIGNGKSFPMKDGGALAVVGVDHVG